MKQLSQSSPKTFNLLSIGQRGVGKTVFLAGSYAQLQATPSDLAEKPLVAAGSMAPSELRSSVHPDIKRLSSHWFECQDEEVQANLEKILHYIEGTGLYPPATIKVTNFNFRLKRHTQQGDETVCNFRWSDIPGESCNLLNVEFQEIVITSHSCCVFINASALMNDPDYESTLSDIFNQVVAIASLVQQHRLKYAIALILTQCDLLEPREMPQIEEKLRSLIERLKILKSNYRLFYSGIPIVTIDGHTKLDAKGAADPLLWLLTELDKRYRFQPLRNLASSLSSGKVGRFIMTPSLERFIIVAVITGMSILGMVLFLLLEIDLLKSTPTKPSSAQQQRSL